MAANSNKPSESKKSLERGNVPLEKVVITEELNRRPFRAPNFEQESNALQRLSKLLGESPALALKGLTDEALVLCGADSAGISISETEDGQEIFRWHAVSGNMEKFVQGTMPRDFSPCGVVLERNSTQLMGEIIGHYAYVSALGFPIYEVLLEPFFQHGKAVGTIWVLAHRKEKKFDREDSRILKMLAAFTAGVSQAYNQLKEIESLSKNKIKMERDAAEEAGRERDRLRTMLMQTPVAVAMLEGPNHEFAFANHLYQDYFLGGKEFLGRPVAEVLPEIVGQGFIKLLNDVYATGKRFIGKEVSFELDLRSGDKQKFIFNFLYEPMLDAQGKPFAVMATISDLTEQFDSRKKIEESEQTLRGIANSVPQMIWTTGPEGKIEWVNDRWHQYAGDASESWLDVLSKQDLAKSQAAWGAALASGRPFEMEHRLREESSGQYRWFFSRAVPMRGTDGKILRWVGTSMDVQRRKARQVEVESERDESRVQASQYRDERDRSRVQATQYRDQRDESKTEASSQRQLKEDALEVNRELIEERELRERFVSTLTHDLRTPLTSAKLTAQLLERRAQDERTKQGLDRIRLNMDRADRMIRDLLDANRLKAGEGISISIDQCHMGKLIDSVVENMNLDESRKITVSHDGRPTEGFWDCSGVERIVENLIGNAIKYGDRDRGVNVSISSTEKSAFISVHNFGNAISKKDQETLFDPYRRLQNAEQGKQKGWGIGLSLVKGLVEAHRGIVRVESTPEAGTTFTVQLPLDARTPF